MIMWQIFVTQCSCNSAHCVYTRANQVLWFILNTIPSEHRLTLTVSHRAHSRNWSFSSAIRTLKSIIMFKHNRHKSITNERVELEYTVFALTFINCPQSKRQTLSAHYNLFTLTIRWRRSSLHQTLTSSNIKKQHRHHRLCSTFFFFHFSDFFTLYIFNTIFIFVFTTHTALGIKQRPKGNHIYLSVGSKDQWADKVHLDCDWQRTAQNLLYAVPF